MRLHTSTAGPNGSATLTFSISFYRSSGDFQPVASTLPQLYPLLFEESSSCVLFFAAQNWRQRLRQRAVGRSLTRVTEPADL